MTEIHDERRIDPRFPTAGEARFGLNGANYATPLLDLSLNGLRAARPEGFALERGSHVQLTLAFPDAVNVLTTPGTMHGLRLNNPFKPLRTTLGLSIITRRWYAVARWPETCRNSVAVMPGHSALTPTPRPRNSKFSASLNNNT